jgi:predicted alpha-1,6-mannanase (GH76 family)
MRAQNLLFQADTSLVKTAAAWLWTVFILFLLAAVSTAKAGVQPGDDLNANTAAAAATLQNWYNVKGRWDTTGWWNAANCLEAIENAVEGGNGRDHLEVLSTTFSRNLTNNFLNEYYDDEGWWALAWMRAYDSTGDARYLDMAKTIFQDMTTGWDDYCNGGLYWKKDQRNKNAIPNELFLLTAVRLHQRTPGDAGTNSYFAWALREWDWFNKSGMINQQQLVNDGLSRWCDNNHRTTWTYNQGVLIGGLTDLYKSTGSTNYLNQAMAIADAVLKTLVDDKGVLREPCELGDCRGNDVPQFKGIFIRYLAYLYDETRKPAYGEFLHKCAHAVWFNDRDAAGHLGLRWNGPFDTADATRHSSAMMAVSALAEPATALLPFAKGSGGPAFNHAVGAPSGVLAWTCNATNSPRPGFMQSGPFLASLPSGAHTVHFRLAVSRLKRVGPSLVRLDVRENEHGTILATREVPGSNFVTTDDSQDFQIAFTNSAPNDPLEFRVYWNAASDAPPLTLTDVTLDGARNWTAANLQHDVGRLDGLNAWEADPFRDGTSGYLTKGAIADDLPAGRHVANFELKVDNFNRDNSLVATVSVIDANTGNLIASREITRGQFPNALWQPFPLNFDSAPHQRCEFRVQWHFAPGAPRLSQRSLVVQ